MEGQNKQTPERFFKLLEAGDLAFIDFMEFAIVVFGVTKHGKTTFSHHLLCHALQAYLSDDHSVLYRLVRETDRKSDARIGATMQSETQIPNKFQTNLLEGQTPVYLIDNPGHLDSFGINRVLSNSYFHYRIFTKIQNMKIILLFDYPMFSGNIKETNEILNIFFNSFSNFNNVKAQLLQSIALVFTKVNNEVRLQDVHERMRHYLKCIKDSSHFQKDKQEFIENLMNQCIKTSNRVNIFRKAQIGVAVEMNPNLLRQISSSIKYFSRDIAIKDEFESKFYMQKKTQMKNIKFSETNKVINLSRKQKQKMRTENLFIQLSDRGEKMFSLFFETLKKLLCYVLFDSDTNEMETKNKLNSTEIVQQNRRKAQRQIIKDLNQLQIKYDESQKYEIRRQEILKRYAEWFKNTSKVDNFIQRLVLVSQIYESCMKFTDSALFSQKNESAINRTRKDFEQIFEKLSRFYSGKEEIDILSKFMYNLNTLLNQMIIFCMIILPPKEQNSTNPNASIKEVEAILLKFLNCFPLLPDNSNDMSTAIVKEFVKKFKLTGQFAGQLQTNSIIHHYLKKFPNVIIAQSDQEEKILKSLKNIELSVEYKIHCEILIFRTLQKKYYYLLELKIFDQKKGQTSSEELSQKDIKCLIKSLIIYLKSVKKIKQLSQLKQFSAYKRQVYQINFSVWTYIVKLFLQLLNMKQVPKNQKDQKEQKDNKDFYKKILIEIVSASRNYSFIQEVFESLITKCEQSLDQISIRSSARKVFERTQKKAKIFSPDSLKCFLDSKKRLSTEIISLALTYADLLYDLGLKDKSLSQCYSVMKYTQFSPQQVFNIEDMIGKIKSKNTGFRIEEEFKSVSEFEATITIKKQLGKFLKDNQGIQTLECVNHEFIN